MSTDYGSEVIDVLVGQRALLSRFNTVDGGARFGLTSHEPNKYALLIASGDAEARRQISRALAADPDFAPLRRTPIVVKDFPDQPGPNETTFYLPPSVR